MFRFLRKIRQKLLLENKISDYLKYGIGEIFFGSHRNIDCPSDQYLE